MKFKPEVRPEITLFHVVERSSSSVRKGENYLSKVKQLFEKEKIQVSSKITQGIVADKIIDEAKNSDYDLIIMGTKGASRRKRQTLGKVALKVVRYAHCPVTVVR